jgi:hypothetical protein
MTVQALFFFLLVLVCPVGMMLMMRGGGRMIGRRPGHQSSDPRAAFIVDLEQQIARLHEANAKAETPELIGHGAEH